MRFLEPPSHSTSERHTTELVAHTGIPEAREKELCRFEANLRYCTYREPTRWLSKGIVLAMQAWGLSSSPRTNIKVGEKELYQDVF